MIASFLSTIPSFQARMRQNAMVYVWLREFQINLCVLLYMVLVHLSRHLDHYTGLL